MLVHVTLPWKGCLVTAPREIIPVLWNICLLVNFGVQYPNLGIACSVGELLDCTEQDSPSFS